MGGDLVVTEAIPARLNRTFVALILGAHVAAFLLLPLVLLPSSMYWALLLAVFVALTVPHWALVHEAIHGHLDTSTPRNEAWGRVIAILFGAPLATLRFGHLSHHALNSRPSERAELFDPAATPGWQARLVFYFRLTMGLYLVEVASSILCFLPRARLRGIVRQLFYEGAADARGMAERAERQLLEPGRLRTIRLDAAFTLAWLGVGIAAYGAAAWCLILALIGRAFLVSFMDNAPHYGGELDEPGQGYDMHLPRALACLVLNTNLHGTHHRHPNLPWPALPAAFGDDRAGYCGSYFSIPLRQLRGPIPLDPTAPPRAGAAEPA